MAHGKIALSIITILILVLAGCSAAMDSSYSELQGNTNGNIHENGHIAQNEDWIFFSFYGSLYRVNRNSEGSELLLNDTCYELNVVNNNIFFIQGTPGFIFKMDLNGKNKSQITKDRVANMIVVGNHIYYRLSSEDDRWGQIYKTDLNGKHLQLIIEKAGEFAIDDGYIFYSNGTDGYSLYRMKVDGSEPMKLNDEYSSSINTASGYVFYAHISENGRGNPYRMRINGKDRIMLSEDECWDINVFGEYIFFRNQSDKGRIYRMNLDGSDKIQISNIENCTYLNVIENVVVFYRIMEQSFYMCDFNGDNLVPIEKLEF